MRIKCCFLNNCNLYSYLFLLFPIIISSRSIAQNNLPGLPNLTPLPPNSAIIEKIQDYRVNLFTGLPAISIPIYTIKTGNLEIPINLIYHASGIRVTDFPGWVGTGWGLEAGGQINRTLMGRNDEIFHGYLSGSAKADTEINIQSQTDINYLKNIMDGTIDAEADVYSYNFPGESGKFFFDKYNGYQAVRIPYAPAAIHKIGSNANIWFKLYDKKGNIFQFDTTREFINSTTGGSLSMYTSAWMLGKIMTNELDSVVFSYYHQNDVIADMIRNDICTVDDMVDNIHSLDNGGGNSDGPPASGIDPGDPGGGSTSLIYSPDQGSITSSYYYAEAFSCNNKEILFKNGKIEFDLDASARQDFGRSDNSKALKRIRILRKTNVGYVQIKSFIFYFGYFISGSDTKTKRLRLDSLQIRDGNDFRIGSYMFQYNNTINLPEQTSLSKDLWGFYNGMSNSSLIPRTNIQFTPEINSSTTTITIGNNTVNGRLPDSVYMQAAILKKITFPTGGHTDFEYETNRHLDQNGTVQLAGGLRVKSIKYYDVLNDNPLIKTYKYGINENGLGVANFLSGEYFLSNEQAYQYHFYPGGWASNSEIYAKKRRRTYYSNPTVNIDPYDGSPVVYPYVTEYEGNGDGVVGKTIYQFRDKRDDVAYIPGYTKPKVISRFYDRGQLSNKKIYRKSTSGAYYPITEDIYSYNAPSFKDSVKFAGLMVSQLIVKEGNPINVNGRGDWFFNNYYTHTDDNYPISHVSILYNPEDSSKYIKFSSFYYYNNFIHQQPVRIVSVNSKSDSLISEIRYPPDYIQSGGNKTNNSVLDSMIAHNMVAVEIEKWYSKKTGSGIYTTDGILNIFKQLNNTPIVKDEQRQLVIASAITDYTPAFISSSLLHADSRYQELLHFNQYDASANIVEQQKENDVKEVYLWGYHGQYPVVKVAGSNYNTVKSFVNQSILDNASDYTDDQIRTELNKIRTGLATSNTHVFTYTYATLTGITSETDPSGKTIFYEYDTFGRLKLVRDEDGKILNQYDYQYQASNNQ